MHQIPPAIFLFGNLTGLFLWAHILLSIGARIALRADGPAINALFAFGPTSPRF
jgi:membrane protein DedA with SNARE-associated domain